MRFRSASACLLSALVLALSGPVRAQEQPPAPPVNESEDVVEINGAGAADGRVAVNAAAGNLNQQANVAVIAIGDVGIAKGAVIQITDVPAMPPSAVKSAVIAGDAFAGSNGMVAVTLAAGSGNQQANLAVIAIGIEGQVATEAMLSQTRASNSPSGGTEQAALPEVVAGVSPGAFAGASGVVQVSLVGGERNSSANIFALTTSEGANP